MGLYKYFLIVVSAFVLLAMIVGCDERESSVESASEVARPAILIDVGLSENVAYLSYPAVIQSKSLSILGFEVGGMVKELNVVEAQSVNKGDVLAVLDQRDLKTKLESAKAQFNNAQSEYQRALELVSKNAISKSELDQKRSNRDVNRSAFESAEKALQDSILVAPYSGAVAKVSIELRQIVQAGTAAITILGGAGLEAKINLPASIIVNANKSKDSVSDSYIMLDAAPNRRIPAIFQEASLEADAASQTYEVTFSFVAPEDLTILPGMNTVVWFKDPTQSDNKKPEIKIPLTAIMVEGEQKYVWVVDRTYMTVSRREISIAQSVGAQLKVLSGLKEGETIIKKGVSNISAGMKVHPWAL